jgi:hypothetical protein
MFRHSLLKWPTRCNIVVQFIVPWLLYISRTILPLIIRSFSTVFLQLLVIRTSMPVGVVRESEMTLTSDIIAHHQDLLNCIFTASGDTNVRHCLSVSWENQNWVIIPRHRKTVTYVSPEDVKIQYRSSWWWAIISLETHTAIKEQWNNKLSYTVASCWSLL